MDYLQLKTNEPLLVAKHVSTNNNLFTCCASCMSAWAKGAIEANEKCIHSSKTVATKDRIAIPLKVQNINEVDRLA